MPLLKLQLSTIPDDHLRKDLLADLSKIVADTLQKPEKYVMVIIEQGFIIISGTDEPAAFIDIKSIGAINGKNNSNLSSKLCKYLHEKLSILPERVYINFSDVKAENWGCNERIFG